MISAFTPTRQGYFIMLPQRRDEALPQMKAALDVCCQHGWAVLSDDGVYRRTKEGVAALTQACKEPIR